MKRFPILIALMVGLFLGGVMVMALASEPESVKPIPGLRSELSAHLEAVNASMKKQNDGGIYALPTFSLIDHYRYYLMEGEIGEAGLADFTGRIVAWTDQLAPPKGWRDRPGDAPEVSLYFDKGELYCVRNRGGKVTYMLEQGQVRQVVSLEWMVRDEPMANPNQSGDYQDNAVSTWRFSETGEITHRSRVRDDSFARSDSGWNPGQEHWEKSYRLDQFYLDGEQALNLTTASDGRLQQLVYHYNGDRQRVLIFDPDGQVAGDYDNRVD